MLNLIDTHVVAWEIKLTSKDVTPDQGSIKRVESVYHLDQILGPHSARKTDRIPRTVMLETTTVVNRSPPSMSVNNLLKSCFRLLSLENRGKVSEADQASRI